jgi:hypothetical protein
VGSAFPPIVPGPAPSRRLRERSVSHEASRPRVSPRLGWS